MKIFWFAVGVLQTLWSVEIGIITFHYPAGLNLIHTFIISCLLCIVDFNIYFFASAKIKLWLSNRWPSVGKWFEDSQTGKNHNEWMKKIYKWRYCGLFCTGFIPHLIPFGIAAQEVMRLRYGYWVLLAGTISKVTWIVCGLYAYDLVIQ